MARIAGASRWLRNQLWLRWWILNSLLQIHPSRFIFIRSFWFVSFLNWSYHQRRHWRSLHLLSILLFLLIKSSEWLRLRWADHFALVSNSIHKVSFLLFFLLIESAFGSFKWHLEMRRVRLSLVLLNSIQRRTLSSNRCRYAFRRKSYICSSRSFVRTPDKWIKLASCIDFGEWLELWKHSLRSIARKVREKRRLGSTWKWVSWVFLGFLTERRFFHATNHLNNLDISWVNLKNQKTRSVQLISLAAFTLQFFSLRWQKLSQSSPYLQDPVQHCEIILKFIYLRIHFWFRNEVVCLFKQSVIEVMQMRVLAIGVILLSRCSFFQDFISQTLI